MNTPYPIPPPPPQTPPPSEKNTQSESFWKKQGKLAFTTFNISSIATLTVTFWINAALIGITLFFVALIAIAAASSEPEDASGRIYTTTYGSSEATHKILSIPIRGPIEGSVADYGYTSIFADPTIAYGYDLKQEMIDAADSDQYDALILEINSPGGTVYGAKAISDGVDYFKKQTGKPVYASVQGMAASGGYWAAASADQIYADTGTGAGSIGVIFGPLTYYDKVTTADGVSTQNGIEQYYLTAGEGKDAGNPFRRLTDKERDIFQAGVNDTYNDFVDYVSTARTISKETITTQVGAHYYGEKQAKALNLIDTIGSPQEAYDGLARKAGIQADYQIVSSHADPTGLASLFGVKLPWLPQKVEQKRDSSRVQACSGTINVPLIYYGNPAQACKTTK